MNLGKTPLKVGDVAPEFSAQDQDGNIHQLANYFEQKLVLYFYPKDNTPGCTAQACNLRDNYRTLQDKGYVLLGISPDKLSSHQKFAQKFDLPFPLLSDTNHEIASSYGVWGTKKFMGKTYEGIYRTTFVIEKGIITHIIDEVNTKDHSEQIFAL
ncbi:MAG: thioredoxin-dependent thiol peroxidase [Bacteroidetes bacterium]|nr:thioredoxin-dependent thiol peroxidase [Bacteroidota bacterium]MCB9042396.1 thioredoxin-dependent thiol peroxidase [Chitinophagales bacterium]